MVIDYHTQKVSNSYKYMDVEMTDSDCSEDYEADPFYQQSGLSHRM